MNDAQCVHFLQWALPHLHMRWSGFRRVRRQVCKRLQRRIAELQLQDLTDYRTYLTEHGAEWSALDTLCQITISRFYRDTMVFSLLKEQVLPHLLHIMHRRQETVLRIWCAGCGAGEEPYTLAMLWAICFQADYPAIRLSILATDINAEILQRARQACYPYSAIKNLPPSWQETGFKKRDGQYYLHSSFQTGIEFRCQDIRNIAIVDHPEQPFHLICCRNLVFTYYDELLQQQMTQRLHDRLIEGGVLLLGVHETLPAESTGFTPWSQRLGLYLKN